MYTKSWREAANLVQEPTARISFRFIQLPTASAAASAAGASLWRVHTKKDTELSKNGLCTHSLWPLQLGKSCKKHL